MMRPVARLSKAIVAIAPMVLVLAAASPARADAVAYALSPTAGPSDTTITVSSTDPCPPPPGGATLVEVLLEILDTPMRLPVGSGSATVMPDRSWSGSVTFSDPVRNGAYFVEATCESSATDDTALYATYEPVLEFDVTSPAGQQDPASRLAGPNRIATAIAASEDIYSDAGSASAVVLSRSDSYADALAGTPLATANAGPLLLTGRDQLDPETEQEIKHVLPPGGVVFLLGGTAAISADVSTHLDSMGYSVVRLAGVDRYGTAVAVADEIGSPDTLLLATGTDFRDGLVAGAAAFRAAGEEGG
ncbi:MAG: hypothetical protein QOF40_1612, partial [Actinomycetota bacterium]|nr:hypothetical protein [Actinomycetota bacterium]